MTTGTRPGLGLNVAGWPVKEDEAETKLVTLRKMQPRKQQTCNKKIRLPVLPDII